MFGDALERSKFACCSVRIFGTMGVAIVSIFCILGELGLFGRFVVTIYQGTPMPFPQQLQWVDRFLLLIACGWGACNFTTFVLLLGESEITAWSKVELALFWVPYFLLAAFLLHPSGVQRTQEFLISYTAQQQAAFSAGSFATLLVMANCPWQSDE